MQAHLVKFVGHHLVFEDNAVSRDDLHAFWTALDVPPELCNMLADRGVMWSGEKLHVNIAYKEYKELQPFLYNACLTVFRFKKFSTSRWFTVGSSMRTLLAG